MPSAGTAKPKHSRSVGTGGYRAAESEASSGTRLVSEAAMADVATTDTDAGTVVETDRSAGSLSTIVVSTSASAHTNPSGGVGGTRSARLCSRISCGICRRVRKSSACVGEREAAMPKSEQQANSHLAAHIR